MSPMKFELIYILMILITKATGAVVDVVCPGSNVSYTCLGSPLRWEGSALAGQCPGGSIVLSVSNINSSQCGQFMSTNVNVPDSTFPDNTIVQSTLMFTVDSGLNGTMIVCTISGGAVRVNTSLIVADLAAFNLVFVQHNTTTGEFSWEISDHGSVCNTTFVVKVSGSDFVREYSSDTTSVFAYFGDIPGGTYSFTVVTSFGNLNFTSQPQNYQFELEVPPSPSVMMPSIDVLCINLNVTISWEEPRINSSTTPLITSYRVHISTVTGDAIVDLNSEFLAVDVSEYVLVGERHTFGVVAVNRVGPSMAGEVTVNIPSPILNSTVNGVSSMSTNILYGVNMNCIGGGIRTISRVCSTQEECNRCVGSVASTSQEVMISGSVSDPTVLTDLTPGATYCYCANMSFSGRSKSICSFPRQNFTTMRPSAPSNLGGAMLSEIANNGDPIYQCPTLQGFDGGSSVSMRAIFVVETQQYSLEGKTCSTFVWFIAMIVLLVLLIVAILSTLITLLLACFCCCREQCAERREKFLLVCCSCLGLGENEKNIFNDESHELKPNSEDVDHEKHPVTGDEYAVVTKPKDDSQASCVQALYQDPSTIEHETAPDGQLYAMTEKKPTVSKKGPSEEELAAMYATPDKAKRNHGLTYASLDVPASGGSSEGSKKPVPLTEYATVIN